MIKLYSEIKCGLAPDVYNEYLTCYAPVDSSYGFDSINFGWSIAYNYYYRSATGYNLQINCIKNCEIDE